MRTLFFSRFIAILVGLLLSSSSFAESRADSREYHLKAAFLRYVVKYVNWPAEVASKSPTSTICVYGEVPSLEGLQSITGKVVNDKSITVKTINTIPEGISSQCNVVFVSKQKEKEQDQVIKAYKGLPILTFGDMSTFAEAGGAMNFYVVNNNLAIMINSESVQQSKLTINPKMLRLVTIVPPAAETSVTN
jgi:hypothetical protein